MALTRLGTNSITALPSGVVDSAALASGVGGSLVKISSQTASNDASIEFTTDLSTTYKVYKIIGHNIRPSVDNKNIRISFSSDGGSNYNAGITGVGSTLYNDNTSSDFKKEVSAVTSASSTILNIGLAAGNGADENGHLDLTLYNPAETTFNKHFNCLYNYHHYSDYIVQINTIGFVETSNAIYVKLDFDSGNIAEGNFIVYGVNT